MPARRSIRAALSWSLLLSACTLAACTLPADVTVRAIDASGKPIAGARIDVLGEGLFALADAEGVAMLDDVRVEGLVGFRIGAASYGTVFRREAVRSGVGVRFDVVLLRAPAPQRITLPPDGEQVFVEQGPARVGITGGSLVRPSGAAATGEAEVLLIPYDPFDPLARPAPMETVDGRPLLSLGMSEIRITQGGEELQPRAGTTVEWSMAIHPSLLQYGPDGDYRLFYVDEGKGAWQIEDAATLAFDDAARRWTAKLPHLSTWNCDDFGRLGACITGRVRTADGTLLADEAVRADATERQVDGSWGGYQASSSLTGAEPIVISVVEGDVVQIGSTYSEVTVEPAPQSFLMGFPYCYQGQSCEAALSLPVDLSLTGIPEGEQVILGFTTNGPVVEQTVSPGGVRIGYGRLPSYRALGRACVDVEVQLCKPMNASCSATDVCCGGVTCNAEGKCAGPATACSALGQPCTDVTDCCAGIAACISGVCSDLRPCRPAGESCTTGGDCCSNRCSDQVCD